MKDWKNAYRKPKWHDSLFFRELRNPWLWAGIGIGVFLLGQLFIMYGLWGKTLC